MSNQRPPGGLDGPTHDPERERPGDGTPAQPWVDPNRTQRYSGRRSIADRLRGESREPDPPPQPEPIEQVGPGSTLGQVPRRKFATSAQVRAANRGAGGPRLVLILAAVIFLGLVGGAAAAWFSGWRPAFLGGAPAEPAKPATDKPPGETKPEAKPGDPATPPAGEIARSCFGGVSEVKNGAPTCGFTLDTAGAVSFQGHRIAERIAAGSGAAQRLVLYPFSPSGRFVFLRACETPSGGRCDVQRLVDTKERKIFEVKGGADGFNWVAWSPKETAGLLGYRDGISETIAIIGTAGGKSLRPSAIRTAKNRYALVQFNSLRWRDEENFSVEVKLCPVAKGRGRSTECEKDDDVKYRRRTVKFDN